MSKQGKIQPKPFLKRGTRQFLSNATVRSLNQKPRLVDFQQEANANQFLPTSVSKNNNNDLKIQIKTNFKSKITKDSQSKAASSENIKAKQNKNINEGKPPTSINSINKKKNTAIDDYIGVPAVLKKQSLRNSASKQKPNNETKLKTMAGLLKRQDEQLQSDQDNQSSIIVPKKQFIKQKPISFKEAKEKSKPFMPATKYLQQANNEQVNFKSDSQEEEVKPIINTKNAKLNKNVFKPTMMNKWQDDQQQSEKPVKQQQPKSSKILQKYYKKQPQVNSAQKPSVQDPKQVKLTSADIPAQLKTQIFQQMLALHQSNLQQKLNQLQSTINKYQKDKQELKQEKKKMAKEKQQFQKQKQKSVKQFQEKMNAQNSKLARQKKYLKGHQMQGKGDWKSKHQSEQLKQKLEQSQNEKKKLKNDLSRQIDRLKKKLQETIQQNESLKGQIKCIQMQKIQIKQKIKPLEKKLQMTKHINYWQDAPKYSYIQQFFDQKFSLMDFSSQYYSIGQLQHYKYYLLKKDEEVDLVHQQKDYNGDKIHRKYKNGKQQIEYINKVLKEVFPRPFQFTIVHHVNNDIKIILPNKISIYYDSKNHITQFKINQYKTIYNFHNSRQIQMKFTTPRGININQIYKDGELVRNTNGDQQRFKKEGKNILNRI